MPRVTYSQQDQLPPLPVPTLEHTCALYLRSLQALGLDTPETRKAIADFAKPGGDGEKLQVRTRRISHSDSEYDLLCCFGADYHLRRICYWIEHGIRRTGWRSGGSIGLISNGGTP